MSDEERRRADFEDELIRQLKRIPIALEALMNSQQLDHYKTRCRNEGIWMD